VRYHTSFVSTAPLCHLDNCHSPPQDIAFYTSYMYNSVI